MKSASGISQILHHCVILCVYNLGDAEYTMPKSVSFDMGVWKIHRHSYSQTEKEPKMFDSCFEMGAEIIECLCAE